MRADRTEVEAAHISWRPLGQLLLDEGLLTPEQLEEALDKQATTGRRLGELAVELGFVSHMALSRVLSAQYGVELKSESGFGTGLRAQLARREDDGEPELPGPDFIVALPPLELALPPLPTRDERLRDLEDELEALRQTSEYGHEEATRLSEALSTREAELASLRDEYQRRYAQAARFASRLQELRQGPESDPDVELLRDAHEYRHAQAVRFATGLRARDARIGELEHELSVAHRAAEETRAQAEHTDREAELLAESLHERDGQLADLRESHARRQSQAAKFATRMRAREAELTYERASLGEALAEIEAVSGRLADRDSDVQRLEVELGNLHGAVGEARGDASNFSDLVSTRDAEIAGLHGELATLRHGADEGHNEAARLAEVLSERDRELGELREEIEGLRHGAHDGHAEATRLAEVLSHRDAELADREHELAQLREAVNRTEEDATRLADEVRGRDGIVAALEGELASIKESAGGRDAALAERDDLVAALQGELAAVKEATGRGHDEAAQLAEALSARDGQLAARDRELAALHEAYGHRHDQAARFARRLRQAGEPTQTPEGDPLAYLVFAQFARRYALVERGGVMPSPDALLELPDAGRGTLRVVRIGPSPLPNDSRSCVFTEYVHGPDGEHES